MVPMESFALSNGTSMPSIGLGVYLVNDVAECEFSVETALRVGHRLIDTAAIYGNERAVGRGIAASGVPREEIFLTTKVWVSDFGYAKTQQAITKSLERLGTDYVDLLLLHQPFGDVVGSWKAMEEAVGRGTVRSIGVSNFLISDLEKILAAAKIRPVINQVERHPYSAQKDLSAFHAKHDIVGEAWYPLGHGSKELLGEPVFTELAAKYGKGPAQIILRWHIQSGFVAIPKSTDAAHIAQNFDIFDFALTDDELARIDVLDRNRPSFRVPRWVMSAGTRMAPVRDRG